MSRAGALRSSATSHPMTLDAQYLLYADKVYHQAHTMSTRAARAQSFEGLDSIFKKKIQKEQKTD